jgi:hypothetical protein
MANDTGNDASVPPGFSVSVNYILSVNSCLTSWKLNVTLPRNAVAAYVEMEASGNGNEEFWVRNSQFDQKFLLT